MKTIDKVVVCSRSFSKNKILVEELRKKYLHVKLNSEGLQLKGHSLISFMEGHNKAIVALERIDETIINNLPDLEVISKYGVGLDNIDLPLLLKKKIKLGWTSGVNKRSVAELALAFAITMTRKIFFANREVLAGRWQQVSGNQLTGKTIGIIGCGNVGKDFVELLQPFNCKILVNDIIEDRFFAKKYSIEYTNLDNLLIQSDVVSIHVPYSDSTSNLLDKKKLLLMKTSSVLINTARGGIVDEEVIKELLTAGKLSAAAFDVFHNEPPEDETLVNLPNFFATPHIGGSAIEAILAMGMAAIDGLEINSIPEGI